MAFSGGTFSRLYDWTTDLAGGGATANVTASRIDAEHDGFATGLSLTICKDGQSTTTAVIPFAVGIRIGDGTVGTPGLHFTSDTDTGIRRTGDNSLAVVAEGADKLTVGTATVTIAGALALGTVLATTYGGVGSSVSNSCRVWHNADQAIPVASQDLVFNSEIHDGNTLHSTSVDTNRITISTDGTYAICGNVRFEVATALSAVGNFYVRIKADGTTYLGEHAVTIENGTSNILVPLNVTAIASLTAGQYITLEVANAGGQTRNIKSVAGISPIFAAARVFA